jgi:hypothetical protein
MHGVLCATRSQLCSAWKNDASHVRHTGRQQERKKGNRKEKKEKGKKKLDKTHTWESIVQCVEGYEERGLPCCSQVYYSSCDTWLTTDQQVRGRRNKKNMNETHNYPNMVWIQKGSGKRGMQIEILVRSLFYRKSHNAWPVQGDPQSRFSLFFL